MGTSVSLMTFAEFEQLPYPDPGKMELVNGEVVIVMPPPELAHQKVARATFLILAARFQDRTWFDHTGYRMGPGNWLEPDVSVSWPDQQQDEKYFLGAPMIAVEILSPGEETEEKVALYFAHGAREVWVINPRKKTMSAYVSRGESVVFQQVMDEFRSEAADGLVIRLSDVFR